MQSSPTHRVHLCVSVCCLFRNSISFWQNCSGCLSQHILHEWNHSLLRGWRLFVPPPIVQFTLLKREHTKTNQGFKYWHFYNLCHLRPRKPHSSEALEMKEMQLPIGHNVSQCGSLVIGTLRTAPTLWPGWKEKKNNFSALTSEHCSLVNFPPDGHSPAASTLPKHSSSWNRPCGARTCLQNRAFLPLRIAHVDLSAAHKWRQIAGLSCCRGGWGGWRLVLGGPPESDSH